MTCLCDCSRCFWGIADKRYKCTAITDVPCNLQCTSCPWAEIVSVVYIYAEIR